MQESLLTDWDILQLFEDMFECTPEQDLQKIFPIFERVVSPPTEASSNQEGQAK